MTLSTQERINRLELENERHKSTINWCKDLIKKNETEIKVCSTYIRRLKENEKNSINKS